MPLRKYGFPSKVKRTKRKRGRPKKSRALVKEPEYKAFVEWAAKPTPLKAEKTAKEFAEKWGVTPETLTRWKKKEYFWRDVGEARIAWAKDKTSDVVHGLFKRASTRGEAAEVKLWMQLIEDWAEKGGPATPNITVIGIRGITNKDLERLKQKPDDFVEGEVVQD